MRANSTFRLLIVAVALVLLPASASAGLRLADEASGDDIAIGGTLESVFDTVIPEGDDAYGRFGMTRAQLNLAGSVASQRVSYRLQLSFQDAQPLSDAYVDFRLGRGNAWMRVGRSIVPHTWYWSAAPTKLSFTQRSVVSNELGFAGGRDIGVFFRGGTPERRWELALVDGSGARPGAISGDGEDFRGVLAGRYSHALLGSAIDQESNPASADIPFASVGVGFLAGFNQDSAPGFALPPPAGGAAADPTLHFGNLFLDLRAHFKSISLILDGGFRALATDIDGDDLHLGYAVNAQLGYLISPNTAEITARFGYADSDLELDDNGLMNFGGRLTWFHKGHSWKSGLEYYGDLQNEDMDHLIRLVMTWSY